jgi:hypothetical protein
VLSDEPHGKCPRTLTGRDFSGPRDQLYIIYVIGHSNPTAGEERFRPIAVAILRKVHNLQLFRLVGEAGIEPTTPGLEGRCSIQLSYSPWNGYGKGTTAR